MEFYTGGSKAFDKGMVVLVSGTGRDPELMKVTAVGPAYATLKPLNWFERVIYHLGRFFRHVNKRLSKITKAILDA